MSQLIASLHGQRCISGQSVIEEEYLSGNSRQDRLEWSSTMAGQQGERHNETTEHGLSLPPGQPGSSGPIRTVGVAGHYPAPPSLLMRGVPVAQLAVGQTMRTAVDLAVDTKYADEVPGDELATVTTGWHME